MNGNDYPWFRVDVEVRVIKANPADADDLLMILGELGAESTVVYSGESGSVPRFPLEAAEVLEAARQGCGLVLAAPEKSILRVAEVAEPGVTKLRVPQFRATRGFPAPAAELASGPVWKESRLRRSAETWELPPGRPRKEVVT